MWHSLNKIIEKEKTFFLKPKSCILSPHSAQFQTALYPSPSRCFSFSLILHWSSKQSFNLWCPFLLQIAKGGHFRSREAHLYVWDFEISGLGGLLSPLIFVGMGIWVIWWVVLLVFCFMIVICEDICWKLVEIAMFGWLKHTHSVLGLLWWCLWCSSAEIAYGILLEAKGRVNLGLESENVMLWVEKEWGFERWKVKSEFCGKWRLEWVNLSLKCHLGLMRKVRLC